MEVDSVQEKHEAKEDKIEFKKPVLFGKIGKIPKKVNVGNDSGKITDQVSISECEQTKESQPTKRIHVSHATYGEKTVVVPYKEPKWSGLCPDGTYYSIEVLKSGTITEKIDLTKKTHYVFARVPYCDVKMAHPTISRFHAVLQYKAFCDEGEPPVGWYIYDLGSTHGTFLNKKRLKPKHYTRVRVGHQIKFGNSSRIYILLGPEFDREGESELTVTEIKQIALQMKLERDKRIQEATEQNEKERLEEERKREEQGIDWGLGEDAEEEPDLADNPYAATANEELYLEDPKKTLRGYFEREGHDLKYDCQEQGIGQFVCRVELPLDDSDCGKPIVAEVVHKGKKKEAVVACALEACRILDRAGLLRQAKHESRRRKKRDWSADDYYDSDEDTFLDRTGSVETKRKKRMEKHGIAHENDGKPLTYDQLVKQITEIEDKIRSEEQVLQELRGNNSDKKSTDSESDSLDDFMQSLGKQGQSMASKAEISKTKMSIQKLKVDLAKTQRLADIARPAALPPLLKEKDQKSRLKLGPNSVLYGKRIKLKDDIKPKPKKEVVSKEEDEFVEEVDSEEETNDLEGSSIHSEKEVQKNENKNTGDIVEEGNKVDKIVVDQGENKDGQMKNEEVKNEDVKKQRLFGPMRPPENYVIPENYFDQETDRDMPEMTDEQ